MRKNIFALCLASAMVFCASAAFADDVAPEHPCVKPSNTNGAELANYESCMAAFVKSQHQALTNHQESIRKAEAAMEQPQQIGR